MTADIELEPYGTGFDWKFTDNDLSLVNGDKQLKNAVTHAVMLRYGEIENDTYLMHGNKARQYVKALPTSHVQTLIKENIASSCKEVEGVSDATVELTYNEGTVVINIIVLKSNGEEVLVDGISF